MESVTSMLTRLHKMEKDISETQYSKRFEGNMSQNQIWLVRFSGSNHHVAKEKKPGLTGAFIICVKSMSFNTSARE